MLFGSDDRQDSLVMALNNNMAYSVNGVVQLKAGSRKLETYDNVGNIAINGAELILEDSNGRQVAKQHLNRTVVINGLRVEDYGFKDTPGWFD